MESDRPSAPAVLMEGQQCRSDRYYPAAGVIEALHPVWLAPPLKRIRPERRGRAEMYHHVCDRLAGVCAGCHEYPTRCQRCRATTV